MNIGRSGYYIPTAGVYVAAQVTKDLVSGHVDINTWPDGDIAPTAVNDVPVKLGGSDQVGAFKANP